MDDLQQAPLEAATGKPATQPGRGWLHQGARVLLLAAPRWEGLEARPRTLASLVLAGYVVAFLQQRVLADGPAELVWTGFLQGWAGIALNAWLCWWLARSARAGAAPAPASLFALLCASSLVASLAMAAVMLPLNDALGPRDDWPAKLQWALWLLPMSWPALAQIRLLWRFAATWALRAAVLLLTPLPLLLNGWLAPPVFWWSEPPADTNTYAGLALTDEVVDAQPRLLDAALAAVRGPLPGRVNVYALTYAPYASEDVFMRESAVVAKTLRERFGADGRLVELVVNPATTRTLPWATPPNLRKTINRMAAVMDREHDVLFLHLTSHGGADGKLASNTWPLKTEALTPDLLKRWLDKAGVRWRVISVSACYSGSWIAPLAGDGTLVMTAADADHTSYGCGRRSELTFFGRAMYEDALRETWSFADAHAAARKLIEVREQEAGKSDGYSNPQISEGAAIRGVLQRLEAQQQRDAR